MRYHANGRPSRRAQSATSVVFPYPGGAVTVTTSADRATRRRFTRPARWIWSSRGGGTPSLERARRCSRQLSRAVVEALLATREGAGGRVDDRSCVIAVSAGCLRRRLRRGGRAGDCGRGLPRRAFRAFGLPSLPCRRT